MALFMFGGVWEGRADNTSLATQTPILEKLVTLVAPQEVFTLTHAINAGMIKLCETPETDYGEGFDDCQRKIATQINTLGFRKYKAGPPADAIPYFRAALLFAPYYSVALYNLASVLALTNHREESLKHLQRLMEDDPVKYRQKARADRDFDALRDWPPFKERMTAKFRLNQTTVDWFNAHRSAPLGSLKKDVPVPMIEEVSQNLEQFFSRRTSHLDEHASLYAEDFDQDGTLDLYIGQDEGAGGPVLVFDIAGRGKVVQVESQSHVSFEEVLSVSKTDAGMTLEIEGHRGSFECGYVYQHTVSVNRAGQVRLAENMVGDSCHTADGEDINSGMDDELEWNVQFINKEGKVVLHNITSKGDSLYGLRFSEGLAAVRPKERWGYINKNGTMKIAPAYTRVSNFSEGLAAVMFSRPDRWVYIDKSGKVALPLKFDWTQYPWSTHFTDPISPSPAEDRAYAFKVEEASAFSNGLALIKLRGMTVESHNTIQYGYAYINKAGHFVGPPRPEHPDRFPGRSVTDKARQTVFSGYKIVCGFSEDLAAAIPDSTPKATDPRSNWTLHEKNDWREKGYRFVEDLPKRNWGYINRSGQWVIEAQPNMTWDNCSNRFSDGLAAVRIDRKWGYMDTTGSVVIAPQFDQAEAFSEGRAAVMVIKETTLPSGKPGVPRRKWGFIGKDGRIVIAPKYDAVVGFSEGLAAVGIRRIGSPR
jgi:hypothetical protein